MGIEVQLTSGNVGSDINRPTFVRARDRVNYLSSNKVGTFNFESNSISFTNFTSPNPRESKHVHVMISDIREEPEKDLIKNDHIQDGRGVNNCQFEIRVFYRRVDIQTANFTCLTKS